MTFINELGVEYVRSKALMPTAPNISSICQLRFVGKGNSDLVLIATSVVHTV
jgi:hypothetical protein